VARYIVRRLWELIPILVGVSLGAFVFLHAIPGNPARLLAGPDATLEEIAAVRARLGLDRPLPIQYLYFLRNALVGDFGRSYRSGEPVSRILAQHFMPTLVLSVTSMAAAMVAGLGVGVVQAVRRNSLVDYLSTVISVAGISTPSFFLGLLLIYVLAVNVHWFPTGGMDGLRSLVLPSVTLAAGAAASIARFARSSLLEVIGEDFVRTARAKGVAERRVLWKHALRNALIPVVTLAGLQFGFLLGGSIVVETVFSWPGLGWLMVQSIAFRDYPVLTAEILLFSLEFLAINLVVDVMYAALDPRVTYA
jgi:glutathione transport system permease protein